MTPSWLAAAGNRASLSLTTLPNLGDSINVAIITIATTATAGLIAATSGFIDPIGDFDPPWRRRRDDNGPCHHFTHWSIKPISAFFFPSLAEEVFWRGILIAPHPSVIIATYATAGIFSSLMLLLRAGFVLGIHVLLHPLAGSTCWIHLLASWKKSILRLAFLVFGHHCLGWCYLVVSRERRKCLGCSTDAWSFRGVVERFLRG
jgi:predicted Abi (CAAX) family protease